MEATLAQRRYLFNLRTTLGWSVKGIREMDSRQCSLAIDEAKEEMARRETLEAAMEDSRDRSVEV